MAKNKIMAIVIAAVIVVAAAVAGTVVLKKGINTENPDVVDTTVEETTEVDTQIIEVEEIEEVLDENGEVLLDENGQPVTRVVTVTKVVTVDANGNEVEDGENAQNGSSKGDSAKTTKPETTAAKKSATTKKSGSESTTSMKKGGGIINAGLMSMEEAQALGYRYNSEGDYFYTDDKDCWQYGFGYNEVYDQAASLAVMYIDDVRIRFDYEGKAWMIQLWKGQYGWVFVGAEIGVYTNENIKTASVNPNDINHYNCADKTDWLKMKMDCYWDMDRDGTYEKIFTRPYGYYWWATGFKLGTLNRFSSPITELKMGARITFKTEKMATLFTKGMKSAGFTSATAANTLGNDTIFQSGKDVYFLWHKVYAETYVEYERTTNSKSKSTTAAPTATEMTEAPTVPAIELD